MIVHHRLNLMLFERCLNIPDHTASQFRCLAHTVIVDGHEDCIFRVIEITVGHHRTDDGIDRYIQIHAF